MNNIGTNSIKQARRKLFGEISELEEEITDLERAFPANSSNHRTLPGVPTPSKPVPHTMMLGKEGARKTKGTTYQCPPVLKAGCNNQQNQGVGDPSSDACKIGDYVYCYDAGPTHVMLGSDGAHKEKGKIYDCPQGMKGGCNNTQKQGIGEPNSDACKEGYFVYCYS